MATGTSVAFDPTVPLGSESLKSGPSRIKATPANILGLFGFSEAALLSFFSPFSSILNPDTAPELQLVNPATDPLSAVRFDQLQGKITTAFGVASLDGVSYSGTGTPAVTSYAEGSLYIVLNTGIANTGAILLDLGGGIAAVRNAANQDLSAGDFAAGVTYLLTFIQGTFAILGFSGGTLSEALTLAGDPTTALGAATKQYVDNAGPTDLGQSSMGASPVQLGLAAPVDLIVPAQVAIPDDGNPYFVYVNWMVFMDNFNLLNQDAFAQVTDGTHVWALGRGRGAGSVTGNGYSPTLYGPGGGITVDLRLQAVGGANVKIWDSATLAGVPGPSNFYPPAYLQTTLVRAHP